MMQLIPSDITFSAGKRFTLVTVGAEAHGTWRNVGGDVLLDVHDVNGESPETVEANFKRWQDTPNDQPEVVDSRWQDYDYALESVKEARRLKLRPDAKTLGVEEPTLRSDGSTFLGTAYYARIRG